ncbi:MAG: hypothetical protein FJW20_11520 [Acidimicrobiia bacterium]|nr:hypothetical protein [Acidimicrobiia bacterium]
MEPLRRNLIGFGVISAAKAWSERKSVTDFGAARDGSRLATAPIQKAIDTCAEAGGGLVYFPPGTYSSGTLEMRSQVGLYLETGARLRGSTALADYPPRIPLLRSYAGNYTQRSLLYAERVQGISLQGGGLIDGQGGSFQGDYLVRPARNPTAALRISPSATAPSSTRGWPA